MTLDKHADIIKAYAAGEKIQRRQACKPYWYDVSKPSFRDNAEYRVKPKDCEIYAICEKDENGKIHISFTDTQNTVIGQNIKYIFDGTTNKLKNVEFLEQTK